MKEQKLDYKSKEKDNMSGSKIILEDKENKWNRKKKKKKDLKVDIASLKLKVTKN